MKWYFLLDYFKQWLLMLVLDSCFVSNIFYNNVFLVGLLQINYLAKSQFLYFTLIKILKPFLGIVISFAYIANI